MGCIYSKAIARSMSIREDLNHGLQSSSVAWEELLTSHGGTDQLFALICSANNTSSTKSRTSGFALPSTDPITEFNAKTETKSGTRDSGIFTRSKSRDRIITGVEAEEINENKRTSWEGSRSFRTVEEYDALLERIQKINIRNVGHFEDRYLSEDVIIKQANDLDGSRNPESRETFEDFEEVVGACETGWKRKAVAEALRPLDVSTIEFPDIVRSSRQRVHVEDGQVYSPGAYVTPKFGSYNERVTPRIQENCSGESSVFSQDLVAAFEDCMQRLHEEEESILWEMDGHSNFDDEIQNQVEVHEI